MASVTDHGAADDPRSGATSLADWATAVAAALDDDDTTVDTRIATSSAADQAYADGVAAAAQSAAEATAAGALAAHEADSTNVHGIADTSALVTTARQIVSGAGLTGGGTLAADRTLAVGAGTGITVNADDVAVNTSVIAPLASPALTGTPTAPTPAVGDSSTKIATTAFVDGQRRVTHPNTDDVLVEIWDAGKGRWQTVHYDSGWRQVSSWNAAGVVTGEAIGAGFAPRSGVAGRYRIRRVNSMVTVQITQIKATVAAPSTAMFGPLTGFRASSEVPFAVTFGMSPAPFSGAHGLVVTSIGIARGGSQHFGSTTIAEWSTATINYLTDDPIPTSLPGTLVSAAPA